MAKISISNKKGITEKISYDRRIYKSVDDNSLPLTIAQNLSE